MYLSIPGPIYLPLIYPFNNTSICSLIHVSILPTTYLSTLSSFSPRPLYPFIHPPSQLFTTHSFILPLTYPFTLVSFTFHSSIHLSTHLFFHPSTNLSNLSPTYTSIHPLYPTNQPTIQHHIHSSFYPFIHSSIHPFSYPGTTVLLIHPFRRYSVFSVEKTLR